MTPADAARLLAVAAVYDKRSIGEADARLWAADLADVDLAEAITAVREHYRTNPDVWVRPGHVLAVVRRNRRARLERGWRAEAAAISQVDPDNINDYLTVLRTARTDLATGRTATHRPVRGTGSSQAQQRRNARGRARCDDVLTAQLPPSEHS